MAGTKAASLYGVSDARESFYCRYGLNPAYRDGLERAGLIVSAVGDDGEVRMMELRDHPFFIGTLFVPQARSTRESPHPVIRAFVDAARLAALRKFRNTSPA